MGARQSQHSWMAQHWSSVRTAAAVRSHLIGKNGLSYRIWDHGPVICGGDQQTARVARVPTKEVRDVTGRGVHTSGAPPRLTFLSAAAAGATASASAAAHGSSRAAGCAGRRRLAVNTHTATSTSRRSCLLSPGSADGGQCEVMGPLHAGGRDIICVTPASRVFRHGSVT